MRINISVNRPFHSVLMANTLNEFGQDVAIYSAAPRRYFRGLNDRVRMRWIPAPILSVGYKLGIAIPEAVDRIDRLMFDQCVALAMGDSDVFIGWAAQALGSARAAKRRGARFVLDRACPHRDFQDMLVARDAERVGASLPKLAPWFRDREIEEYELAEFILVPSAYTMRTFPDHLQPKLIKAPLLGRSRRPETVRVERNEEFTVGVVGGHPLRKGYLHLLQAWRALNLPNARLLLRADDFSPYPVLQSLADATPSVERVGYVSDISEFYQRCDAFVLPSVDDGFGMALIEAMQHQRACIATTHCGASEIMSSGKDGIVVPPADSGALAEAILKLYEDEDLRRSLAEEGAHTARRYAESHAYECAMRDMLARLQG